MRILFVNKFLYRCGGCETYVFQVGGNLARMGHEVQYFGMDSNERIVNNNMECYVHPINYHRSSGFQKILNGLSTIYSTEAYKKIMKVLEDFLPDVVHINNFNYQLTPSILLAIRDFRSKCKRKLRIVYTAHDYKLICPNYRLFNPALRSNCEACIRGKYLLCVKSKCIHNSAIRSLLGAMEAKIWRMVKVYRLIDTIICPSAFLKGKFDQDPLLTDKTIMIHNAVDMLPQELCPKKDYVLYFGRYSQEKGLVTLLKAARELPHIRFVFAGDGELKENIQGDNVQDVGFQSGDELRKLIMEARFSIYPSEWYENCPYSVIESQIFGTPVLGANIGGIPELIKVGKNGELFQSGNTDDLKKKIQMLWDDPMKLDEYRRNCSNIKFDTITEYCEKLIKIYGRV